MSRETRLQILSDIAGVIEEFNLPVVASIYQKATYGQGVPEVLNAEHGQKRIIMQTASVTDCAIWADRWLETFASDENGMIIAEDADRIKPMLKKIIKLLRTPALLRTNGMDQLPGVPLRRIIDTVHFAAKEIPLVFSLQTYALLRLPVRGTTSLYQRRCSLFYIATSNGFKI